MSSSSLDDQYDLPFPERRALARARMVNTNSRLSVSGVERVCRVRDLSPIGVGLEGRDPPLPGQRVWIEMNEMVRSPAVVIWREAGRCGLRFEEERQLPTSGGGLVRAPRRPRMTRFLINSPAHVAPANQILADREGQIDETSAEVIDISTGGLKLGGSLALEPGCAASIRIDGLAGGLFGHILWRQGATAGFRFDRPIGEDELFSFLCCRAA